MTDADYCHRCGAKVIRRRLTFRNLFEHLSETFFNYDNKLLRTIIHLLKDPTDVIDGYVKGVRKKYVNPLSFFGLSLTLSGVSLFILQKFFIDEIDFSIYMPNAGGEESFTKIQQFIFDYNSFFFAFLIPFFAAISWIVFINKKYNLTEHIVLFCYTLSLLNIISILISQLLLFVTPDIYAYQGIGFFIVLFFYHCYVYKGLFSLTWKSLVLKTLLFFAVFFVAYVGISLLITVLLVVTGVISSQTVVRGFLLSRTELHRGFCNNHFLFPEGSCGFLPPQCYRHPAQ